MKTLKVQVTGRVQGVGFRYFVKTHADNLNISGYAKNLTNGQVEVIMQGEADSIDALLAKIELGPSYSEVASVDSFEIMDAPLLQGFSTR